MSKIKDELLRIQKASGGILHAESVVVWAASHKRSALHAQFIWDDRKAAQEYRLWQARRLIQLNVVMDDGEAMLVSLSVDRPLGGGYRDISDVVADEQLSEIMLRDAIQDLERVRQRYSRVKQLVSVWAALDALKPRR